MTWWAFVGGAAALALGLVPAGGAPSASGTACGALAALLFVLPVAVHGFRHWSPLRPARPARALAARSSARCGEVPPGRS